MFRLHLVLSAVRILLLCAIVSLGYVGSESHRLLVLTPADPGNPALRLSVSEADEVDPGTSPCVPFAEGGLFTRANGQTVQVRRPFSAQFDAASYQ